MLSRTGAPELASCLGVLLAPPTAGRLPAYLRGISLTVNGAPGSRAVTTRTSATGSGATLDVGGFGSAPIWAPVGS